MLPFIYDDNVSAMRDEGVYPSRWSPSSPGAGSAQVVENNLKLSTNGGGSNFFQSVTMPSDGEDFILYVKIKAEYSQGRASVLHLTGSDGKPRIGFALGYSYISKSLVLGQLSVVNKDGSSKSDFASMNYMANWCDLAIHGCREMNSYRVYLRDSCGEWLCVFSGDLSQIADVTGVLIGTQFSLSQPSYVLLDHILICHPNIVSVGDSICSGYSVPADPACCWQKYARPYAWLRNDLIVSLGYPGSSSQNIRDRIVSSSFSGARVVFLHASSNDFRLGVSSWDRTSITQASINAITGFGAACVLLNGVYPNYRYTNSDYQAETSYQKGWWETSGATLMGLAGRVDITLPLRGVLGPYAAEGLVSLFDGKHPNVPGYMQIGRMIENYCTIKDR